MSKKGDKMSSSATKVGVINLTNERTVDMVEFDLDLSDDVKDMLVKYAKDNIDDDQDSLINWSVNKLLKDYVDKVKQDKKDEEARLERERRAKKVHPLVKRILSGDFDIDNFDVLGEQAPLCHMIKEMNAEHFILCSVASMVQRFIDEGCPDDEEIDDYDEYDDYGDYSEYEY